MSNALIDFHTHILPGLDHGSKSIEETKAQIALFLKYNVREVVCTSHFYGHVHRIDDFLAKKNGTVDWPQLKRMIAPLVKLLGKM